MYTRSWEYVEYYVHAVYTQTQSIIIYADTFNMSAEWIIHSSIYV